MGGANLNEELLYMPCYFSGFDTFGKGFMINTSPSA